MTCRAVRVNDQMICPYGRQWDIADPEPPACVTQAGAIHPARREYLGLIKQLYGLEGVKK